MGRTRVGALLGIVVAIVAACSADDTTPCNGIVAPSPAAPSPTIFEIDPVTPRLVYAVSDIHGGYERLLTLLAANHLIENLPPAPAAVRWSGGDSILVVVGDLIDKGPQPVEVIDSLRALQSSAAASEGLVLVLLGNHEAEFFADPNNDKATGREGINKELAAKRLDCGQVAAGIDPRGAWLRSLPLGARLGRWFYAHAGNTKRRSILELERALHDALLTPSAFGHAEITGADSILEARAWYVDPSIASATAGALNVAHIVFGHDPNALGARGAIGVGQDGLLVRIDCGMSPDVNDSSGCLLRIRRDGSDDVAEQLTSDGRTTALFRSPSIPF